MTEPLERLTSALADRYRIDRELGRGGMATVYLAEDLKHERKVAVKVLRPELAAALGAERFLREIKITARLTHPHILPLLDSGEANGFLYYVMPYVAGESLRERLDREKQLALDDAVQIAREVADALSSAHSHDVVHRDIKPENILLEEGHAVVADFGIARAISTAAGTRLTETGLSIGTPLYMSPEQAAGAAEINGRSDLYSLGCVLYEMLAGHPPFTGATAQEILIRVAMDPVPSLRAARPSIPERVEGALYRVLEKVPADRYATATQFADALVGAEAEQRGVALPLAAPRTWTRSHRRMAVVASGTVVLALGLGYVLTRGLRATGAVVGSASTIAVMPFVPVTDDTALQRLGRELVVTLSANLDGVGGIRTSDPLTVLALVGEDETVTPERGAELARRLGARSVLYGTLLRTGQEVRLDIGLLDAEDLEPLARSTVSSPLGEIAALTDSATFAVIKQVWRRGNVPAPSLASITTRSVAALRAYLEGERALAQAEFGDAVRAFEQAFAADSTFWFAFWRSVYPRVYEGTRPDSATIASLIEHREELPEADRLLIESRFLAEKMSEKLVLLRQVRGRFPTYWPGWYDYANLLVHRTPYMGTTYDDARAALERTVELNPGFAPAWEHLFWIAAHQRDTAGADRALREVERISSTTSFRLNPDLLGHYRVVYALVASGGDFTPDRLEREAEFINGYRGRTPAIYFGIRLLLYGFPRAQVKLANAVLARGPRGELAAAMWMGKGFAHAARGGWDSALVAMDRWVRLTDDSTAPLVAYGLAVTGARLGSVGPEAAAAIRPRVTRYRAAPSAEQLAELAWLDGILAHARGDAQDLTRARRGVRASGSAYADLLDRSLEAFQSDLAGDRARAARALAELEWQSAERGLHDRYGRHHPFFNVVNRLSATPWLLAAGDTAQAARLLTWHEAVFSGVHRFLGPANRTVGAVALFERARIEAALGRTSAATPHFREFLQRYDMPRGEWVGRIEETIGTLLRLSKSALSH